MNFLFLCKPSSECLIWLALVLPAYSLSVERLVIVASEEIQVECGAF